MKQHSSIWVVRRCDGLLVDPVCGCFDNPKGLNNGYLPCVTPGFEAKPNAHSMCAQELSSHTYRSENGYIITNVSI
jgi:hypothetical protein